MKICSWNIRGCNDPLKLQDVCSFIRRENLDVFGILETRVKEKKAFKLAIVRGLELSGSLQIMSFIEMVGFGSSGILVLFLSPLFVCSLSTCTARLLTIVQALHSAQNWLLVGDFNVVRDSSERITSSLPNLSDILEFNACLLACGLEDMSGAGCDFTWTNNQDGQARVWCKLDRALVKPGWFASFPSPTALFLPPGISDHSPVMVTMFKSSKHRARFSFLDCWIQDPRYNSLVYDAWKSSCYGTAMFKFFFKLKQVRGALWGLHRNVFSNIQSRIMAARNSLEACQVLMQSCSSDEGLIAQERLRATYMKLLDVELSILRQKAKADGIVLNDCPTKYFYDRVNERRQAQIIGAIDDHQGVVRRGLSEVAEGFVEYYKCLLGSDQDVQDLDYSFLAKWAGIRGDSWSSLVRPVLDMEIDIALASIKPGK
ncbi:hypothetical protein RND81_07G063400 [Saponaria officinalis]|uniref:Endonuclease/exonuclease/phosphatase domain-containing protein n=1 Tax=Saponaria officinalis TaxID=3572 RepID=A0AAW1JSG1_SAPOF